MSHQVYQILKDEIISGVYQPNDWLQEKDLAAKLNVSRSPVREALRQLAADGLVREVPNKGMFVRAFTPRKSQRYSKSGKCWKATPFLR